MHTLLLSSIGPREEKRESFVPGAFESDETCSLYSLIRKSDLKTCADTAKKTKFKYGKGGVVTAGINSEIVFRRARSLARCRHYVSVAIILSHLIEPVPMFFLLNMMIH